MKKFRSLYFSLLAVASLGLMTSCGDDNDDPTPAPAPAEMTTYSATILGNQNASTGSFFSSSEGVVYSSSNAAANAAKVDLVYYYSVGGSAAANLATLASPSDASAQDVYSASTTANIPAWTKKNNTMFKTITAANFTSVANGDDIKSVYTNATGTESSKLTALAANSYIAFKTEAGKHALARVVSVDLPTAANGNKSEIKLDFKVEK
jgi:hypothetical protein